MKLKDRHVLSSAMRVAYVAWPEHDSLSAEFGHLRRFRESFVAGERATTRWHLRHDVARSRR